MDIDMRQYIAKTLDGMTSITEKDMLRDVMENIFLPLYDHVDSELNKIERRVKEQLPLVISEYAVWTTLLERGNAYGGSPYLFPMLSEDLHKPSIELSGLKDSLRDGKEIRLDTVFIQADYLECKEIADNREIYEGTLKYGEGNYRIGVRLRQSKRYAAAVENLYKLFIANSIPWQTINAPYMFKMFDVILARIDIDDEASAGSASDYTADFGKHSDKVKYGLVPVWNIQKLTMKSEDIPLATINKVNYEYVFDLSEEGTEHGYLADYHNTEIVSVRRENDTMTVTTPMPKGIVWSMYKVKKRTYFETENFRYELMNNALDDSFAARMIAHYGTMVKTNAELQRLLEGYDVARYIRLESFQVIHGETTGETYEVNSFLTDEIRDIAISKTLLLKFRPTKPGSYILRDMMSFLTSQVQLIYPEFKCVGVLV